MPEGFQTVEKGKQIEKLRLKRLFVAAPDLNGPNMNCPLLEYANEAPVERPEEPEVENRRVIEDDVYVTKEGRS
jgi:hypothetical protein